MTDHLVLRIESRRGQHLCEIPSQSDAEFAANLRGWIKGQESAGCQCHYAPGHAISEGGAVMYHEPTQAELDAWTLPAKFMSPVGAPRPDLDNRCAGRVR